MGAISWDRAYNRLKGMREFASYYGRGNSAPPASAFRGLYYSQRFEGVAATSVAGTYGATSGPVLQTFPSGAIILAITASAFQAPQEVPEDEATPSATSFTAGRRDLFGLSLQYTNDEQITPNGLTAADALLGSGSEDIFPSKEIVIPPSQGILTAVASLDAVLPLTITVVFHCMVPRAVG